jgi:hypothetical protein
MSSLAPTDNIAVIHPSQWSLTDSTAQLISGGRRGRTLFCQATGGTVLLGDKNIATSGIGMQITGSQIFNDYGSAAWYAVGVGGNATLNVQEIY